MTNRFCSLCIYQKYLIIFIVMFCKYNNYKIEIWGSVMSSIKPTHTYTHASINLWFCRYCWISIFLNGHLGFRKNKNFTQSIHIYVIQRSYMPSFMILWLQTSEIKRGQTYMYMQTVWFIYTLECTIILFINRL